MKTCSKCKQEKTLDSFYALSPARAYKRLKGPRLSSHCKECQVKKSVAWGKLNRETINKRVSETGYFREYYKKNREKVLETTWRSRIKTMYGITPEIYESMFRAQNGVCSICEAPPINERLCVDHNHTTGKVRGLLCKSCNVAIGRFNDDTRTVKNAISYLEKHAALGAI